MTSPLAQPQKRFLSLKFKLLLAFSIVFSAIFAGTFFQFYRFATRQALERLREDMENTLSGAAAGIDVPQLLTLYHHGEPNAEQFSDDPRFHEQLEWMNAVNSITPQAWLYTYVPAEAIPYEDATPEVESVPDPLQPISSSPGSIRRIGAAAPGYEVIFLVDLWADHNPTKAARFLEPYSASRWMALSLQENRLVQRPQPYTDDWGNWISAYAPLHDGDGNVVAGVGIDVETDYVKGLRRNILAGMLRWLTLSYCVLFLAVFWLSEVLTRKLSTLTQAARLIGVGNYEEKFLLDGSSHFRDELDQLADVFQTTVETIQTREKLIREVRQTEDEVRTALQEERELNELISRFVSMVSHELRTPLTVVRTSTELLQHYDSKLSSTKRDEYYQRIRSAIQNMAQLIDDVLVAGKAEAGKMTFEPLVFDLADYCQEFVDEVRSSITSGHILNFKCDSCPEPVCMDPKLLRIMLSNLVFNAIKYSPDASTVDVSVRCGEKEVVFEIRDHGIGIPEADWPHLFQSFHRARNVGSIRGTGLGLAIVNHCVNHHQGKLFFTSEEGKGTTFVIKLPIIADSQTEPGPEDFTTPSAS